MAETKDEKRSGKSAEIVERMVRGQLRAMGCHRFDLGILPDAGDMILRERQRAVDIEKVIKWLRDENARGAHIYIRPAGTHGLSLIDDLNVEVIHRMKAEGFEPAVVVETSTNNFQHGLGTPRRQSRSLTRADPTGDTSWTRPLEEGRVKAAVRLCQPNGKKSGRRSPLNSRLARFRCSRYGKQMATVQQRLSPAGRFQCGAPPLHCKCASQQAYTLSHTRRLRVRRIGISRNPPGRVRGLRPEKMA